MYVKLLSLFGCLMLHAKASELTDENLQATYLSTPSLDLEASIKCVNEPTDPLRRHMILVCIPSKESEILTQTEVAAIKVYIMDAVYVPLNAALRSRNSKNIQPWFPYLKIFHNAVKKLSTTNRSLCFGERTNWIASREPGSIVTWWTITSLTLDVDFCRRRAGGLFGKGTLFWITSKSARSIKKFTLNVFGMDHVLLPGTKLKINSITTDPKNKNVYIAHLEELVMFRENEDIPLLDLAKNPCPSRTENEITGAIVPAEHVGEPLIKSPELSMGETSPLKNSENSARSDLRMVGGDLLGFGDLNRLSDLIANQIAANTITTPQIILPQIVTIKAVDDKDTSHESGNNINSIFSQKIPGVSINLVTNTATTYAYQRSLVLIMSIVSIMIMMLAPV